VGHPVGDGAQRGGANAIQPLAAGAPLAYQPGSAQHRQVLRHRRRAHGKRARQRRHRLLAVAQAIEQAAARAVGDGPEDIFSGGRTTHAHFILKRNLNCQA
jgi:hypothetical protein